MNKLVIQDDEGRTTVVPLIREEITIGRKDGNTIRLTERNVSRRHARILRSSDSVSIEDLGSYNGIRVNGNRIEGRCSLSDSDRVQIGDYLIEIRSDSSSDLRQRTETQPLVANVPAAIQPGDTEKAKAVAPVAASTAPIIALIPSVTPVESPIEFADTQEAPVAVFPRLVIVSKNMAGIEFDVMQTSMVIGRGDENDIVIDHRSISRNHAKIVNENGRHFIVDMQSSNGVRVNGEDYGKVELRAGDMIDLGHVRMRFVAAGEDFIFGRDAMPVDITPPGSGRRLLMITALVVASAAVAFFTFMGGSSDKKASLLVGDAGTVTVAKQDTTKKVPVAADSAKDNGSVPPVSIDAAIALVKKDAAPQKDPPPKVIVDTSALMAKARDAMEALRWQEAIEATTSILKVEANSEAAKFLAQAKRENLNQSYAANVKKAVRTKGYKTAKKNLKRMDVKSRYFAAAKEDHAALFAKYVKDQSANARRLHAQGKCRKLRNAVAYARRTWPPAVAPMSRYLKTCKEPDITAGKSVAEIEAMAKAAWHAKNHSLVLRLTMPIIGKSPKAAKFCTMAACMKKRLSTAKRCIKAAKKSDRFTLANFCSMRGVDLR